MTEVSHLRCDKCELDIIDDWLGSGPAKTWTRCIVGLKTIHFCPVCWQEIMQAVNFQREEPNV